MSKSTKKEIKLPVAQIFEDASSVYNGTQPAVASKIRLSDFDKFWGAKFMDHISRVEGFCPQKAAKELRGDICSLLGQVDMHMWEITEYVVDKEGRHEVIKFTLEEQNTMPLPEHFQKMVHRLKESPPEGFNLDDSNQSPSSNPNHPIYEYLPVTNLLIMFRRILAIAEIVNSDDYKSFIGLKGYSTFLMRIPVDQPMEEDALTYTALQQVK